MTEAGEDRGALPLDRVTTLLQELTIAVGAARDAREASAIVTRLGRELLGASSSAIWLVVGADGALELVASDGVPEEFLARWRRVEPGNDLPAMHAIQTGEPLWVSGFDEYRAVDAEIAEQARRANRPMTFAALPLSAEAQNLGVIVFAFERARSFAPDERQLALAVAGHAAQALERARLQAAQARALAGLRIVAKAGEMLTASLDVDATLTALAKVVVPDVADWCAVDMFVDGNVRRLTAHHADPAKVALAREFAERFPARLDDPKSSLARMMETGEPIWVRRITPEMFEQGVDDPEQRAFLVSLGLRSVVQVPLLSEGRVRGAVSFIMSESGREYDEADRDLLVEIGRRAGLALTNASLYEREQRARDRLARLATVTAALARAPTSADVGEVACREGAAALGASNAVLYAVSGHELRLVAQLNYTPEVIDGFRTIALDVDTPVTRVVHTGEPIIIESSERFAEEFPALAPVAVQTGEHAMMFKPLADRSSSIVGALGFGFPGRRSFTDDERAFARTLADHCAQAFERARILDLERTARARLALLAAAGETFSATIDYEETLAAVVDIALPVLGDFAFFDVVETNGEVRRTSRAYQDPEVDAILAQSRWVRSERTDVNLCALSSGASAIHADIDDAFLRDMATTEAHLAVLRALRLCSMITVPVSIRGERIGALTLCHGRSGRHHTQEDLELALELARRGAIAVEQARLYRASRDAARRAEEANRMKDDFLATVSHELRTPLNAILGWAHLLEAGRGSDPSFVRRGVEVIRRNANAQRELIDDILDVSRIITGKLRIETAPVDLASVVRDALEVVRPAADAKGVHLVTRGTQRAAPLVGDGARLQQVVWNLLSNAVKFTGAGGTIRVELDTSDDRVTVRVIDDGIGIAPEVLPYVFDRFRQADSSSTRSHGGLGLGLSIVRHLVELHGGTVSAASDGPGKGATFEVVLPVSGRPRETPPPAPSEPRVVSAGEAGSLVGVRVLVVDDDADSRDMLELVLGRAGAQLHLAANADDAMRLFDRHPFDVVISDIAMPEIDGYALLGMLQKRASETGRPLRAVALTAYGRGEDRSASERAGFVAHLTKPVSPDEVLSTLARVL